MQDEMRLDEIVFIATGILSGELKTILLVLAITGCGRQASLKTKAILKKGFVRRRANKTGFFGV